MNRFLLLLYCIFPHIITLAQDNCDPIIIETNERVSYELCNDTLSTEIAIINSNLFLEENCVWATNLNSDVVYGYSFPFEAYTNESVEIIISSVDTFGCPTSKLINFDIGNGLHEDSISAILPISVPFCHGEYQPSDFISSPENTNYNYNWILSTNGNVDTLSANYYADFPDHGSINLGLSVSDLEQECTLEWNIQDEIEILESPNLAITSLNSSYCGNSVDSVITNTSLNNPGLGELTYLWSVEYYDNLIQQSTESSLNFLEENHGPYEVLVEVSNESNSCTSNDSSSFTVEDLNLTFDFNSLDKCSGFLFLPMNFTTDEIDTDVIYQWEIRDDIGSIVFSSSSNSPAFLMNIPGVFDLYLNITSAIENSDCTFTKLFEDAITIKARPELILSIGDTILCDTLSSINVIDNSYLTSSSQIQSMEWNLTKDNSLIENSFDSIFEYAFNEVGSYLLGLTNTGINGCTSFDEINISVHEVTLVFENTTPRVECYLDIIKPSEYLSSDPLETDVSFLWSLKEVSGDTPYQDLTEFEDIWNMSYDGTYDLSVLVSDNGCFYGDTLEEYITIKMLDASIVSNINNCAILPTTMEIFSNSEIDESLNPDYNWTFTYSNGDTLSNSFLESPNIELDSPEIINASLTLSADGCINSEILIDSIGIGHEIAKLDTFTHIASNCLPHSFSASEINLLPEDTIFSYEWTLNYPNGIDIDTSNLFEGNFLLNESGPYDLSLKIYDNNSCSDEINIPDFVLMDRYDLVIRKIDNNSCFNSVDLHVDSLNKFFHLESFEAEQNYPMTEIGFNWIIQSPTDFIQPYSETIDSAKFVLVQPGEYTAFYTKTLDDGNCQYTEGIPFNVGVIANIEDINPGFFSLQGDNGENSICLGKEFSLNQNCSPGIGSESSFEWTSDSAFSISNIQSGETTFSGYNEGFFDINLSVINDSLCMDTVSKTIEIYDLHPAFSSPNIPEVCVGDPIRLDSENNYFIDQFNWDVSQENYIDNDSTFTSFPTLSVPFNYFTSNDVAFDIDIELSITSIHGCNKSIKLNNMIDVVGPLPKFILENEHGCDSISTKIIDISDANMIDNYSIDYGNNDTLNYNLNDIHTVAYTFPYPYEFPEGDSCYFYQINLAADYHSCLDTFMGEVRLYPNPILDIQTDITKGCNPLEIEFENINIYAPEENSEFHWNFDFGLTQVDFVVSSEPNPTHTYNIKKQYSVFHSATTSYGCYSENVWENLIEVFDAPIAEFDVLSNKYCYGMGNATYQNNSIHDSDSLLNSWVYENGTSNNNNLTITYDSTAFYDIYLHILDANGCEDSIEKSIFIEVLDTIVALPLMNYVTIEDNGIEIFWADSIDDNFDNLNLYSETNFSYWESIYDTYDPSINEFFDNNSNPYQDNYYTLIQQDSCGYFSDSTQAHSPILLQSESTEYETVSLNWTAYQGWDSIKSYDIYRAIENSDFQYLDQVSGDSLSYNDSSLCNINYRYFVLAIHPEEEFTSRSNKVSIEPLFIDFNNQFYIDYTSVNKTVEGVDVIVTSWPTVIPSSLSYYFIDRWDEYFGWLESDTVYLEPPYVDFNASVQSNNYRYRVQYSDLCGNLGPLSKYGQNILLEGEKLYPSQINLKWNRYDQWENGVERYDIHFFNENTESYQFMESVSATTYELNNIDPGSHGVDSSYCYRVTAINFDNPNLKSYSNKRCFLANSLDFSPNAFSPNGDGINETFKIDDNHISSINIEIYNRWGNLVFTSKKIDFEWDGTDQSTGQDCPQGNYIYLYELVSFDGTFVKDQKSILLLR